MIELRPAVVLTAALLAACGGSSSPTLPSSPSPVATPAPTPVPTAQIAGDWSGSARDGVAGLGIFSMTLRQNGTTVAAAWGIVFNGSTVHTEGGTLTGQVTGNTLEATARPQAPHTCGFHLTATIDGNHITGRYTPTGCTTIGNGRLDIRHGSPV